MSAAALEVTYRRLLRAYPRAWRAHRQQEVLDVLLQTADDAGRGRVGAGEAVGLLAGGLEERLERALQRAPLAVRERTATLALLSGAALAMVLLACAEVPLPGTSRAVPFPVATWGPVMTLGVLPCTGWVLALLLVAVHRVQGARWAVLAVLVTTVGLVPLAHVSGVPRPPLFLLGVQAVVAALAACARLPWSASTGRRVVAAGLAVAVALGAARLGGPTSLFDPRLGFYRSPGGLPEIAVAAAAVSVAAVVMGAVLSWHGRRWVLPAVVVAAPWTYLAVLATAPTAPQALDAVAGITSALLVVGISAAVATGMARRDRGDAADGDGHRRHEGA